MCCIEDTKLIRNPFRSIHAIALGNLGELTSGLLMTELLHNKNKKGIITKITCTYYKKARGKIIAECKLNSFDCDNPKIITNLYDSDRSLVCIVNCYWTIQNL